jgi:hypothetical protein
MNPMGWQMRDGVRPCIAPKNLYQISAIEPMSLYYFAYFMLSLKLV